MERRFLALLSYLFFDLPHRVHDALATFEDAAEFSEKFDAFLSHCKIRNRESYSKRHLSFDYDQFLLQLSKLNQQPIFLDDPRYPDPLKEIGDAPAVLYAKGNIELLKTTAIGIVGSRECSDYGRRTAESFGKSLASYMTVVSGLARGIDTAAHNGALSQSTRTIAVIGTAIDQYFPKENVQLQDYISTVGCLISEYPPGVGVRPNRFPQRNRLIAGLSRAVLLIEARDKSGALITAKLASEYGRDVLAIPGEVDAPFSKGCHRLIQDGAKLVTNLADILDEFPELEVVETRSNPEVWSFLSETHQAVFEHIKSSPDSIDGLIQKTGLSVVQLLQAITSLQQAQLIQEIAGERYAAVNSL